MALPDYVDADDEGSADDAFAEDDMTEDEFLEKLPEIVELQSEYDKVAGLPTEAERIEAAQALLGGR